MELERSSTDDTGDASAGNARESLRSQIRESLPWIVGCLLVILGVVVYLWWTDPPVNPLPEVYSVL